MKQAAITAGRNIVLGVVSLVALLSCRANAAKEDAVAVELSYQTRVLEVLRVYTGDDGLSHAQVVPQPAQESTYLGALLRQFPLGDPSNVVIVSGPPNFRIPQHPSPYREIFVLLSGASVIELSDGTQRPLRAGSVVLFEDTTGPGHAGLFGPVGYVALDIQFKAAPGVATK